MLSITPVYAALLALLYVALSVRVILQRRGDSIRLRKQIAECAPFSLVNKEFPIPMIARRAQCLRQNSGGSNVITATLCIASQFERRAFTGELAQGLVEFLHQFLGHDFSTACCGQVDS